MLKGRQEVPEDGASSSEDEEEAERRRARARARRMQYEMQEAPLEDDEPDEDDHVSYCSFYISTFVYRMKKYVV